MKSFAQKVRTAQYLATNAGPLWIKRFLRNLSPETTLALVKELERNGMPTALNLEIPSWRVEQIVARTVTLEPASTVTIPSSGPLPEEAHGWLPYRARELQGVTLDVDSGLAFASDLVIAQSGSGTRASRDAAFVSGATVRIKSQRPTILNSPIAPVGDVHHHYHFMLETLPRMLHAKEHYGTITFVTSSELPSKYQRLFESLELSVENRPRGDVLIPSRLVLVDQPDLFWPRRVDLHVLSRSMLNGYGTLTPRAKIYLERGASSRQPANEADLVLALGQHEFENVNLAELEIQNQWLLISSAQIVVSPHGASLATIPALSRGSRVVELSSGDQFERCYQRMSALTELDYHFVQIPGLESSPSGNALCLLDVELDSLL